jgi:hypothetical protein
MHRQRRQDTVGERGRFRQTVLDGKSTGGAVDGIEQRLPAFVAEIFPAKHGGESEFATGFGAVSGELFAFGIGEAGRAAGRFVGPSAARLI